MNLTLLDESNVTSEKKIYSEKLWITTLKETFEYQHN
jgi:hypothetical protein